MICLKFGGAARGVDGLNRIIDGLLCRRIYAKCQVYILIDCLTWRATKWKKTVSIFESISFQWRGPPAGARFHRPGNRSRDRPGSSRPGRMATSYCTSGSHVRGRSLLSLPIQACHDTALAPVISAQLVSAIYSALQLKVSQGIELTHDEREKTTQEVVNVWLALSKTIDELASQVGIVQPPPQKP